MKKLKQLFCFTTIFAMLFSFSAFAAPVAGMVTSERMGSVPSKSAKSMGDATRSVLRGNIISIVSILFRKIKNLPFGSR